MCLSHVVVAGLYDCYFVGSALAERWGGVPQLDHGAIRCDKVCKAVKNNSGVIFESIPCRPCLCGDLVQPLEVIKCRFYFGMMHTLLICLQQTRQAVAPGKTVLTSRRAFWVQATVRPGPNLRGEDAELGLCVPRAEPARLTANRLFQNR